MTGFGTRLSREIGYRLSSRSSASQDSKTLILVSFSSMEKSQYHLETGHILRGEGGGATKWENRGSETFAPPSQDRVKLFAPPPFKVWKLQATT